MEKEERLIPLPPKKDLQGSGPDYPLSYSPLYDEETFVDRRSIKEYLNVVLKRLPLIVTLSIVVTAIVAFYMYRQPSVYESSTRMVIEPRKPKVQAKDGININLGSDPLYMNTQLQLLQNPDLMKSAVVRLGLQKDPNAFANDSGGVFAFFKKLFSRKSDGDGKASLPVLSGDPEKALQESQMSEEERQRADRYAGILLGGLGVELVERTSIVNVTIKTTNPEIAPKVADSVAELFIQRNADLEVEGAQKAYDQLTKSIDDLKSTIAQQEQEFIQQMESAKLPLQEGKGTNLLTENASSLQQSLNKAREERQKLQQIYDSITRARENAKKGGKLTEDQVYQDLVRTGADQQKVGSSERDRLRALETKIAEANTELSKLLVKYTEENPKVQIARAEIAKLESEKTKVKEVVAAAEAAQTIALKSQIEAALKQENELRSQYLSAIASTNEQSQAEMRLTTLDREIKTNRSLLDTYIQRQKEQELAIASGRPENLRIDAKAMKPGAPVGPPRNKYILVAFLLSLAAGIGLAFLLDYVDDSIKTSDDVGRHLGLPTLALIPHHAESQRRKLIGGKADVAEKPLSALVSLEDTRSATAEAYRHLRTSLLFSSAGKPPQTILVTSSQPSEGKTTTAINIAITLAQSGAEVVIIDCDLRRPRLHSHFDLPNSSGLTNYLSGENNPEALIQTYPGLENLKIITSGPIPPNPAELLGSAEMRSLLQYLRGNFQHVIVDSPPAISFTDASILSTVVDGVVLVAMAGKSSVALMRKFKQRLSNIGARIYGVVLNGITQDSVEYGYYGYSYSYYDAPEDDSTPKLDDEERN